MGDFVYTTVLGPHGGPCFRRTREPSVMVAAPRVVDEEDMVVMVVVVGGRVGLWLLLFEVWRDG